MDSTSGSTIALGLGCNSAMAQLQHSFSKAAVSCGASPFENVHGLPYVVVEAGAPRGAAHKAAPTRRAVSAQLLSTCPSGDLGLYAPPRYSTYMGSDIDELIAASLKKPGYGGDVDAPAPYGFSSDDASSDTATDSMAPIPEGGALLDSDMPTAGEANSGAATALPGAVQGVLGQYGAVPIASGCTSGIAAAASSLIAEGHLADTFYIYDMGEVVRLFHTWRDAMPRVAPFYAVKCNPEPSMVALLNALGAGFDCASIQELERAAAFGVPQSRVIFAQPCKRPADFRYAAEKGVEYTTFDCASELEKIAAGYPAFKCVLRIRCDDADAKINLGLKYGADMADVPELLGLARDLGLQVVGVSFHVGSGCQNVGVYGEAITNARAVFDLAEEFGYTMSLLDIGGGFTAPYDPASAGLFYRTATAVNDALERHFPPCCGVRIIAEPGRYFAETSATLFTTILGQRSSLDAAGQEFRDYWLSDGTYGSFRIQVAVDGLEPSYSVLRSPLLPEPSPAQAGLLPCRLWGNSDQDNDCVHKLAHLPALRNGDWLMFPYAGAYTICSASNFGGVRMTEPQKLFVFSEAAPRDLGGWGGAEQAPAGGASNLAHAGHVDGLSLMAPADDGSSDAAAGMVCGSVVAGDDVAVGAQEVAGGGSCACGMECEACPSGVSDGTAVDVEDGMEVTSAGPCC